MKLLVNGCSFTGGNDVVHNEEGLLAPIPDYVWSNHTGVDTTNIAIAGNSNDKIIRTTIEHLKQTDDYDGVIIQWTALYRLERYIEQYDVWGNICNKINVLHKEVVNLQNMISGLHTKVDQYNKNIEEMNDRLEKHIKFIDDTYDGLRNPIKAAQKFFKR